MTISRTEPAETGLPEMAVGDTGSDTAELFCPVSLGDWLELCRTAGVAHVPAERIATLRVDDCMEFDVPGPPPPAIEDSVPGDGRRNVGSSHDTV